MTNEEKDAKFNKLLKELEDGFHNDLKILEDRFEADSSHENADIGELVSDLVVDAAGLAIKYTKESTNLSWTRALNIGEFEDQLPNDDE
jgi:hypothetical protein